MTLTQQQQHAAARRQLRERGMGEAQIDRIEQTWTGEKPALPETQYIGWCDEHKRYFIWPVGCTPDNVPTGEQIREYYQRIRAPFTDKRGQS